MTPIRRCIVRVDGATYEDLVSDMIAIEVCERVNEPSSFALQVAIFPKKDGTWTRLDAAPDPSEGGFAPWQRITVSAGYSDKPDVLIDGYVSGVAPRFETAPADCHLLVWGYDASHLMDIEEKVVDWPDKKYSEIASAIFSSYGLTPQVKDTQVVHKQENELLIQRGTDWQFLKRLADRVGFELSVRGGNGVFAPPDLSKTPQKDLAAHFGPAATNLQWFEPRVVANLPSRYSMSRINPVTKAVESLSVSESPQKKLGKRDGEELRSGRACSQKVAAIVTPEPLVSEQAMSDLATGLRRQADWIVTGEGEIEGTLYGSVLRSGRPVLIKGVGKTYSGSYYVTEVIHRFTPERYSQRFRVVRNGVGLLGSESFGDATALVATTPPPPASPDDVKVRKSGRVVAP